MHILIVYGSLEGQTQKISQYIAEIIQHLGHQATTLSAKNLPAGFSLDNFDAAIIGGPIHMGRYPGYLTSFVTVYRDRLNRLPSALFTVCMAIHSQHEKSRLEALHYGEKFMARTGWRPTLSRVFAGAVRYTQYNLITRFIMKMIARKEGGSTDTSRDHEYTDWQAVEQFAVEFIDSLAGKKA
jgi:menaquinone-dependent protoporphyrinogen oxidase